MSKKEENLIPIPPGPGIWHFERGTLPPMEGNVVGSYDNAVFIEAKNEEGQSLDVVILRSTITAAMQVTAEKKEE